MAKLNIKELNCQACQASGMIDTLQEKLKCRTIRFNLWLKPYPLCGHHSIQGCLCLFPMPEEGDL